MENIKIPSPSAILDPAPTLPPSTLLPQSSSPSKERAPVDRPATGFMTNKPKQSKSRNGCITCKAKRLKCDESKPTCLHCKKRKVECGGYKKDFKWRPFEETNVVGKISTPSRNIKVGPSSPLSISGKKECTNSPTKTHAECLSSPERAQSTTLTTSSLDLNELASLHGFELSSSPNHLIRLPTTQENPTSCANEISSHIDLDGFDEEFPAPVLMQVLLSEHSPWLSDTLPSEAEIEASSKQDPLELSLQETLQRPDSFSFADLLERDEDIEEIVRHSDQGVEPWILRLSGGRMHSENMNATTSLPMEPNFDIASPEMLVLQFDRLTCGILSVKDGILENPWRTLIWPLAKDTPALYHAIFSLAAFHSSKGNPMLRPHGVYHMRQSITFMAQDIQDMRTDAALATSLALAFADTWDQHTRTCIQHLRGAKVSQALRVGVQNGNNISRLRFLHHTWLYMDVIARLTSCNCDDGGDQEIDFSIFQLPSDAVHEIDPLMGCATTLFPLIYQVARLIQRVRNTESNSISLVSQAIELKRLIEQWEPPDWFEPPEDPTSEVQHSVQIAHAYRWATLLYLHQAVPEIPSEPVSGLAKRVLLLLATVPPSSRTTIIQMFPLLAGGCEAEPGEDREWVLNRWAAIQSRLSLGAIDRCIEVVREVWSRRDTLEANYQQSQYRDVGGSRRQPRRSSAVSPLQNIEFDRSVRGRLHWANVMQEWGWEVFLG